MARIKSGLALPAGGGGGGKDIFLKMDQDTGNNKRGRGNTKTGGSGADLFLQLDQDKRRAAKMKKGVCAFVFWTAFTFCLLVYIDPVEWLHASRIQRMEKEIRTLKVRVASLEAARLPTSNSRKWATAAPGSYESSTTSSLYSSNRNRLRATPAPTPTRPPYKREKSLGPLQVDYDGLLDDPWEVKAIDDLEALLGQQLDIFDAKHASYSFHGIQVKYRHVTQVNIRNQKVTRIPDSLKNLKRLEYLGLEGNNLTSLPDVFQDFPSLKEIRLAGNPLVSLPPSLQHMTRPINIKLKKY